ncbi:hypothetical protein ACFOU2_07590 [Bacillus songklensis]|uniref:Phenylacetate--CoA ligase family protein n=1 Tax=Bacillus songklensis TaxID=1069116 RepID=A0ABV8AZJ8_9BACI
MNRLKFKMGYMLKRPEVLRAYQEIKSNESKGMDFLQEFQNRQLQKMVKFAVENVPYYTELFSHLHLNWQDIKTVKDLEKIPILTKDEMKRNPESFIPKNQSIPYVDGSTGGSTGVPLKYRMSKEDYARGVALLLRGFGFAGYHLGDKMSIIAGSSLVSKSKSLKSRVQDYMLNFHRYLSYGMDEKDLQMYLINIQKNKPLFLRGYASSIYIFAKYLEENQLSLDHQIKAIFSTSEMLFPQQRRLIEKVFKTKVKWPSCESSPGQRAFITSTIGKHGRPQIHPS